MASVQDHAVDVPLGRPKAFLGVLRQALGLFFLLWFAASVLLLIVLSAIGGERLLDKMALPLVLASTPFLFAFLAWPAGRLAYSRKLVEADVRRIRGTQDRYEIVSLKAWPKFAAKLRKPFP